MTVTRLDDMNFDKEVKKSGLPVIIDFWAEWCGPCKSLAPVLHEIASLPSGKFKIAKVSVDDNPGIANKYSVMNIPTMIIFKAGEEVERLVGFMPKARILSKIESVI